MVYRYTNIIVDVTCAYFAVHLTIRHLFSRNNRRIKCLRFIAIEKDFIINQSLQCFSSTVELNNICISFRHVFHLRV